MPIVASATVQTNARKPLLIASGPTASIAIAGSQYSMKTSHRLDRMSRDSQVVASDFILPTAASVRSRQLYSLECSPESCAIRATRKLSILSLFHYLRHGPAVRHRLKVPLRLGEPFRRL